MAKAQRSAQAQGPTPAEDLIDVQGPAAESRDACDPEIEAACEIDDLIAELGSERAVIRALLHDMTVLLADADRAVSRGYLRGLFSSGARPAASDDED